MRNLEEFPITTKEIIECLEKIADELCYEKTGLVGDMRPALLNSAISSLQEIDDLNTITDMRHAADMRAIKRWHVAHPDKINVWPDQTDLLVWLMEQKTKEGL